MQGESPGEFGQLSLFFCTHRKAVLVLTRVMLSLLHPPDHSFCYSSVMCVLFPFQNLGKVLLGTSLVYGIASEHLLVWCARWSTCAPLGAIKGLGPRRFTCRKTQTGKERFISLWERLELPLSSFGGWPSHQGCTQRLLPLFAEKPHHVSTAFRHKK